MPFDILSVFAATNDAAPLGAQTMLPLLSAPVVPITNAAGGSLFVPQDGEYGAFIYLEDDGTQTDTSADITDNYTVAPQSGVPLGPAGNQFVFTLTDEFVNDDGEPAGDTVGMFIVQLGEDGTIASTTSLVNAFGSDTFAGFASLELIPLADGRVGYIYERLEDNAQATIGVISDEATGLFEDDVVGGPVVNVFATFDAGLCVHMIALPDGGTAVFTQDAGAEFDDFTIWQFGADNALLDSQPFDTTGIAALGVDIDALDIVANIDANGDLQMFVVDADAEPPQTYLETLDLLPATDEPVIEPPLPSLESVPTEFDDILTLTDGDDVIDALGGDDTIYAGDGQDWVLGSGGNDVIFGGVGDDLGIYIESNLPGVRIEGGLYGGDGSDTIYGRDGIDEIEGGDGNDDLRGGAGDEARFANTVAAGISGGNGQDFIRGNAGNDNLSGGQGSDDMNGGSGDDNVYGGTGNDKVSGYDGNDALSGGFGDDQMHGGRGDDRLTGGNGDDVMRGNDGDDLLNGGEGDDLMAGGEGADVFTYYVGARSAPDGELTFVADNGVDLIKDFTSGEDKIAITGNYDGDFDPDEANVLPVFSMDDIFLSQEDSFAVIQAGDTTIRLRGVDIEDLSEDDFSFL